MCELMSCRLRTGPCYADHMIQAVADNLPGLCWQRRVKPSPKSLVGRCPLKMYMHVLTAVTRDREGSRDVLTLG